jgi:predicted acetyltransferase
MATVDVSIAAPEHRDAIANMMQLYIHDFSEQWAGEDRGELQDDGRFEPYSYLDDYWRETARIPLLIHAGGHLAGFALLSKMGHTRQPVDRNMAEFFVVRKHRRGGVGLSAAQQIFTRYPGVWEAAVARKNVGALAFWRRAVGEHQRLSHVEEIDIPNHEWNGPILRFRIKGPDEG